MFDRNIARVVDLTISEVGRAEFDRLSTGLDVDEIRNKISYALNQLDRLSGNPKFVVGPGGQMNPLPSMPDYLSDDPTNDQWLALFYMLWYQPRQVLLAYHAFSSLLAPGSGSRPHGYDRPIEVLDYGCGTLAGLFGLTISLGEHRDQSPTFRVFNHDTSKAMIALGRKLWTVFKNKIKTDNTLYSIAKVVDATRAAFNSTQLALPSSWQNRPVEQIGVPARIVSAFHCLYKENIRVVSSDLEFLLSSIDLYAFVLTASGSQRDDQLLSQVLTVRRTAPIHWNSNYLGYDDYAFETTSLRRWIREQYTDLTYVNQNEHFLRQRVPWSYGVAKVLVC